MQKLKKVIQFMVLVTVLVLLAMTYGRSYELDQSNFSNFKSFDRYEEVKTNPRVYKVYKENTVIGYLSFGKAYGYQSDIHVGVVISDEGRVIEAIICEENETPSFIKKIHDVGFLHRAFYDKTIADGFDIEKNISGVSGATISSKAITQAIGQASQIIGYHYLDIEVPDNDQLNFGITEIVLLGMLLLTFLTYKTKNKKLRTLTMTYSILLLGFQYRQFIAYSWLVSLFIGKTPDISSNFGWYILIVGALLFISLSGKNLYCAYICPFGQLQQAEHKLAGFKFLRVNAKLKRCLQVVPGFIAYVAFVIAITTEQMGVLSYEPFSLIYGRTGTGIQWALLPIVLLMSLLVSGFYCHNACPVGFVLRTLTKFRNKVMGWIKKEKKASSDQRPILNKTSFFKEIKAFNRWDILMVIAVLMTASISLVTIMSNM